MDFLDNLPILKSVLLNCIYSLSHMYVAVHIYEVLLSCKLTYLQIPGIIVWIYLGNHYFVYHTVSVLYAYEFSPPNGTLLEARVHIYLNRYVDSAWMMVTRNALSFDLLSPSRWPICVCVEREVLRRESIKDWASSTRKWT